MAITLSGSLILSGSIEATGGVTISGSIASASYAENASTASYVVNSLTASYVVNSLTASYVVNSLTASFVANAVSSSYSLNALTSSNAMTASSADTLYVRNNVTALGSITAQTLVVQTITSSVDFVTGSTRFGSLLTNTHLFTGSVAITGSLAIDDVNVGRGGGDVNNNTAVGYQAMQNNTTGNYNTAFGASASFNNATTNNNTAIGYRALINSSGSFNTAVGSDAGQANTTGTSNTFIGKDAGYTNVTGTANTSIGLSAGYSNTVGTFNSFIGYYSGYSNSVGGSNVFIGNSAGGNNTSGSDNAFVGSNAGAANTTGNFNSYLGSVAGFSNTTGAYNIFIGRSAGRFIANKSTGATILDNSIMIGFQASPLANNQTNQIVIGYDATGLGSNTTVLGNSSTTTTAIYGNVGIGTTNPTGISSDAKLAATNGSFIVDTENNGYGGLKIDTDSTGDYNVNFRQGRGGASGGIRFFTNGRPGGGGAFSGTGNERLTILGTGNVGIGTSSPSQKLEVIGTTKLSSAAGNVTGINIIPGSVTNTYQTIGDGALGGRCFASIETGYANYDNASSSYMYFKTQTSPATTSDVSVVQMTIRPTGDIRITTLTGTGTRTVVADANGQLSAPVSDKSVKENIRPIGYGINDIMKMNPVWFEFKEEFKDYGTGRQNGNIAQELEAIIPEAVFLTPQTNRKGIEYGQLHAVYIKAIQELKAENDSLKEILLRNNIV